jgi:N-acetyl sugar amidotransferase
MSKTRTYQICNNCVMDTTDHNIVFDENGICDYCLNFFRYIKSFYFYGKNKKKILINYINKIKKKNINNKYDCLIGLSGGVDSSYLAHVLVKEFGLRILAIHVDTGWNSKESVNNIEKIIDSLNIDLETEVINWREMKDLQLSFFKAQHPNLDIPQDHAIFASIYKYAVKNKINHILTGGNFATECIREPLEWAYHASDLLHIKKIHSIFGNEKLKTFPFCDIFTYKIFYKYFLNINVFQPLNYVIYHKDTASKFLESEYSWISYTHKHYESRFTKFYEGYWLKEKFNYDKRKPHFSSLILTSQMTRSNALKKLSKNPLSELEIRNEFKFVCEKLDVTEEFLKNLMNGDNKNFKDYKSNHNIIQFFIKLAKIIGLEKRIIR